MSGKGAGIDAGDRRDPLVAEERRELPRVLAELDAGRIRVAEKRGGEWVTHQWVKKAVLLSFRLRDNEIMQGGFTLEGEGKDPYPLSAGDASSQAVAIAKDLLHLADIKVLHGQDLAVAQELDGLLGLGPIGDMAARIAMHRGHRVIGVDLVPERLERVGPAVEHAGQPVVVRDRHRPVEVLGAEPVFDRVDCSRAGVTVRTATPVRR